jgi:YggT family protein
MANFLILLLQLYNFLVLARVLLSYFPNVDYNNPIVRFLYEATEPVLRPIRDFLRQQFGPGPVDFSPIVLFILILILTQVIRAFL